MEYCRWDCITIDEKPISEELFHVAETKVLQRNRAENIGASEFEILTATAFDIFTSENVEVAVVEVGMGGRDDATNILKHKDLTILTKIGLDHQSFLGDTIEEIASHKCGIFAKDVPVIYNATNEAKVLQVINEESERVQTGRLWPVNSSTELPSLPSAAWEDFKKLMQDREQQRIAVCTAWRAYSIMYDKMRPSDKPAEREKTRNAQSILNVRWPGRLQMIDVFPLIPGVIQVESRALLDGAHNSQAAENLAKVVDNEVRRIKGNGNVDGGRPVTWILACTTGRDILNITDSLLRPRDRVASVEFGPVDGMPWISSQSSQQIMGAIQEKYQDVEVTSRGRDIQAALQWAFEAGDPVVIAGSLYLAGDVLRMLRDVGGNIGVGET